MDWTKEDIGDQPEIYLYSISFRKCYDFGMQAESVAERCFDISATNFNCEKLAEISGKFGFDIFKIYRDVYLDPRIKNGEGYVLELSKKTVTGSFWIVIDNLYLIKRNRQSLETDRYFFFYDKFGKIRIASQDKKWQIPTKSEVKRRLSDIEDIDFEKFGVSIQRKINDTGLKILQEIYRKEYSKGEK